jgi:mannose-6-phosphate isomerase-like protein (cupin superfamily)
MNANGSFDLGDRMLHLEAGGRAVELPQSGAFWEVLIHGTGDDPGGLYLRTAAPGWLMGIFEMKEASATWEMHPAGGEALTVLTGAMTVVLDEPGGERRIRLVPGRTCLVPQGVWHRFEVHQPGRLLALTWGTGTEHRPV